MILTLTDAEKRKAREIIKEYETRREAMRARMKELRHDEFVEPKKPKSKSKKAQAKYDEDYVDAQTAWYEAGSEEWRTLNDQETQLTFEQLTAVNEYLQQVAQQHFKAIEKDHDAVVSDAFETIDGTIEHNYSKYASWYHNGDSFVASNVRVTPEGFVIDEESIRNEINENLELHFKALEGDDVALAKITIYIDEAIASSEKVSSRGKLSEWVRPSKNETTKETELVTYAKQHIELMDNVSHYLFKDGITRQPESEPDTFFPVPLDGMKKANVLVYVCIDYADLIKNGDIVSVPTLTGDDWDVYHAIVSLIYNGNYDMTYDMIYRAMKGKKNADIVLNDTSDAYRQIDEALSKFRGIFRFRAYKDSNGESFEAEEPLLQFSRGRKSINGQMVDGIISIPRDQTKIPVLYRFALFNRKEVDTRDITLLDVPKYNDTPINRAIKRVLYHWIIDKRNKFEKHRCKYELDLNQRRFDMQRIYDEIGWKDPDKKKCSDARTKADKCLSYWKRRGLIEDYEFVKYQSRSYNRIEICFLPKQAQTEQRGTPKKQVT